VLRLKVMVDLISWIWYLSSVRDVMDSFVVARFAFPSQFFDNPIMKTDRPFVQLVIDNCTRTCDLS
jgi:hypothetical protein